MRIKPICEDAKYLRDRNLSLDAKGLLSLIYDTVYYRRDVDRLISSSSDSKDHVLLVLDELTKKGYIKKLEER